MRDERETKVSETIRTNNLDQLTLAEMEEFVTSYRHVSWSATGQGSVYRLIERVLKAQQYRQLKKGQKEVVKRFLGKVTTLTRGQITRLIERWIDTRRIERQPARRPEFAQRQLLSHLKFPTQVPCFHRCGGGCLPDRTFFFFREAPNGCRATNSR